MAAARPIRQQKTPTETQAATAGDERLTPLREMQLVERCRAGGETAQEALCELLRGYQRRIYTICIRMVKHHDDATDLTQDVMIKLIEGLPNYNGQSKLSTWVIRIAMNCCLSHLRRQKLRSHESLDVANERGGNRESSDYVSRPTPKYAGLSDAAGFSGTRSGGAERELSPLGRVEQEQTRTAVLVALNVLDADLRALLVLRDVQDLDYQQIAEVLDVPLGTVKSRLFRARAALRELLESHEGHSTTGK